MDEWTLNDLLECSVCLERLDTSSKVLPCQHTFCKKCLEDIVSTKKELRCPECRVLVETSIDNLPPNVLLMRILEGMRNAVPKKKSAGGHAVHHQRSLSQPIVGSQLPVPSIAAAAPQNTSQQSATVLEGLRPTSNSKQVVLPNQHYARALYDYISKEPGDLSFKKGDIICLRKKIDENWFQGEMGRARGVFPLCFVQVIPLPTHIPQCKALYDFRMTNDEEEGCLSFMKGEIITVIRRVDENWAEGRLAEKVGIFPLAFVEMNGVARALMKLSTNSQPGPSRVAPPTPTSEETTPLIPTDHSRVALTQPLLHQVQQSQAVSQHTAIQPPPQQQPLSSQISQRPVANTLQQASLTLQPQLQSDSSSSVTSSVSTTPNTSATSSNSSSSTTPSSPASPPSRPSAWNPQPRPARPAAPATENSQQKRHSLTSVLPASNAHSSNRHSAEVLGSSDTDNKPNPTVGNELVRHGSGRHHRRSGSSELPISSAGTIPPPLPQGTHHSLANSTSLPATYIALYPYKPQKADELELRKGSVYTVTERCQDGWFKGTSNRTQKSGVFPGNYVALARTLPGVEAQLRNMARGNGTNSTPTRSASSGAVSPHTSTSTATSTCSPAPITYTRERKGASGPSLALSPRPHQPATVSSTLTAPPVLPPRSASPALNSVPTMSVSWHTNSSLAANDVTRSSAVSASSVQTTPQSSPQGTTGSPNSASSLVAPVGTPQKLSSDKNKDKKDRGGVSLMRRLTNIKKSKSPPPPYSMDNPVFEDGTLITAPAHPVHVRSGSCPSQLLQLSPSEVNVTSTTSTSPPQVQHQHRLFPGSSGGSQRLRHKDRPSVVALNLTQSGRQGETGNATVHSSQHRKSSSLDASSSTPNGANHAEGRKNKQLVQPARERFRCVVAYPPHSEYELELRVGDVIYVHRKREDGWYKGTQQRTGRTGLFPASFVEAF